MVLSFHDRCLWPQIYSKEPATTAIVNFINMHCMDNMLVANQRTIKRSEFTYAYSFEHKVSFKLLYVEKHFIIPTFIHFVLMPTMYLYSLCEVNKYTQLFTINFPTILYNVILLYAFVFKQKQRDD